jgi:catechol 2,3-dioxygenase-like lactoylglutathione lyase family enzyme
MQRSFVVEAGTRGRDRRECRIMLIGYTTVGTNDLQRAMSFYDALFGSVGVGRLLEIPGLAAWGLDWNKPIFGVAVPFDGRPATVGNGSMIALGQRTRDKVRILHAKMLDLGGADEGAPGMRGQDGSQAFYAAYARDLDGNKLCFYSVGGED